MKLDDLFEQERNIRMAMTQRAGVVGLMLHQTIDHDPRTPMLKRTLSMDDKQSPFSLQTLLKDKDAMKPPPEKINR